MAHRLAACGDGRIIVVVRGIDTEATAGECFPEETLVDAAVAIGIRLDPSIAGGKD